MMSSTPPPPVVPSVAKDAKHVPPPPVILSVAKDPRAAHIKSTRSVSLLLALLLIATIVPGASAQDAATDIPTLLIQTADGTPTSTLYAEIEPGERGQVEVNLAVDADEPVAVTTAIANAVSPPNGGFGLGPANDPLAAPATWLDLDTSPLTLETGETVARTIEIAVPANTEPGQYVAAFTLTAVDPVPILDAAETVQLPRATAAIAITVPGAYDAGFELGDPTFVGTATGGRIQVPVENTGTVPVHPQGTLTLEAPDGRESATIPVTMGAIFANNETILDLALPDLPPAGDYRLALDLTDADTRATATLADLTDIPLTIPEPPPGAGEPEPFEASPESSTAVSFEGIAIDLEGTPLQSVAVEVDIANVGSPIPAATLTLEVIRNGQLVDEIVIAERVALTDGVTGFSTTYIPDDGFGSGLVSFRIRLDAIAPDGTATLLIQSGTVAKIDVP